MSETFDGLMDFMEDDEAGFTTPPIPSREHPGGHQYKVPAPDAKTGLKLNALADIMLKQSKGIPVPEADIQRLHVSDEEERHFLEQVLGVEALNEMSEDGVQWPHIQRLGQYAFTYFAVSQDAAAQMVKDGLFKGKAMPAANRATRRAKTTPTTKATAGSKGTKKGR
jgi:hypothetical protein